MAAGSYRLEVCVAETKSRDERDNKDCRDLKDTKDGTKSGIYLCRP